MWGYLGDNVDNLLPDGRLGRFARLAAGNNDIPPTVKVDLQQRDQFSLVHHLPDNDSQEKHGCAHKDGDNALRLKRNNRHGLIALHEYNH